MYCIKCGVKLAKSEKKCPLCNTKVVILEEEDYNESAYPNLIENFSYKKINWHYFVKLSMLILLILGLITCIIDLVAFGKLSWSFYVICGILCLCTNFLFIYIKNKYIPILANILSVELLLFVISYFNNGLSWYLFLVMPFILIIGAYILICTFLLNKKRKIILKYISVSFIFFAFALILIEILVDLYNFGTIFLSWSIYSAIPIAIISLVLFIISFNKKLLDQIKQKMFF